MYHNMIHTRGSKLDYDTWSSMGAKGWSYDEVLPLFKDIETIDATIPKSAYRGTRGPVHVTARSGQAVFQHLTERWLNAASELGYKVGDSDAENQLVFSPVPRAIRNGVRENMGDLFLRKHENSRTNIHYRLLANVTKVLMKGRKAIGVEYFDGILNKTRRVCAEKEVILAAGPFESPRLLMVSGIGPKKQLKEASIPVISNLPGVGRYLQDHPYAVITFSTNISAFNANTVQDEVNYCKYLKTKTGVYSSTVEFGMGFLATNASKAANDAQIALFMTFEPEIHGLRAIFAAINAKSRGTVTLNSTNPGGDAIVDINYLSRRADKANLLEAVQVFVKLAETNAFKRINMTLTNIDQSLCSNIKFASSKYWSCFVRKATTGFGRFAGTCRMGGKDDRRAVVDPRLRVRTVRRLRVIDSSVMPIVTRGNAGVGALLFGWKGALIIKQDHGL